MGRTTERATSLPERDFAVSAGPRYLWTFPGAPVKIQLSLEVMAELTDTFSRAPVQEGLLLGWAAEDTVEIDGFERLPERSDASLASGLTRFGAAVTGYYRVQKESSLRLSREDFELADAWLTSPSHVFLLVANAGSGQPVATFFFREGDTFYGDVAFLEFPFDPAALAPRGRSTTARPPQSAAPRTAPVGQMRHHASKQPFPPTPAPRKRRVNARRIAAIMAGAVLLSLAPFLWSLRPKSSPAPQQQTGTSAGDSFALGLNAERQNSDVKVTWSRDAAAVSKASSAVMTIRDGGSERQLLLNQEQARSGNLLYMPAGGELTIRLAVSSPMGEAAESLMVVLPKSGEPLRVSPTPSPAREAAQVQPAPKSSEAAVQSSGTASRTQPLRPFLPPAVSGRGSDSNAPTWEAPPVVTATAMPAVPAIDPELRRAQGPAVPPLQRPAEEAAAPATPAAARRISSYVPPRLVRQAMPVIPQAFRPLMVARTVEVRVSLDENGKVTAAEVIRQPDVPKALADSARTAAWLCRFEPASMGGQAQRSELLLRFQFKPAR